MPDAVARGCRTPSRDRLPDAPPSGRSKRAGAHARTALNATASRPSRGRAIDPCAAHADRDLGRT